MDQGANADVPFAYDEFLGPLMFEPFAKELVAYVPEISEGKVLELACGTGRATKFLRRSLPSHVELVSTDVSADMIAFASSAVSELGITWRQADAHSLPFEDASFEMIVCQFGAMFFTDRILAFRECTRVLKEGRIAILLAWCELAHNPFAQLADEVVNQIFVNDPPKFFEVPFGWHDSLLIRDEPLQGGFRKVRIQRLTLESGRAEPTNVAKGFSRANPVMVEIGMSDPSLQKRYETLLEKSLRSRYGDEVYDTLSANVIICEK